MPPDAAGSLEEDEYLAIKDYIFDLKYSGSIQKIENIPRLSHSKSQIKKIGLKYLGNILVGK